MNSKLGWHEFAVAVFVESDPASALQEKFIAQIVQQAGIVGADHEIQVAVGIQVAPGHGIGRASDAGQHLAAESAGLAGLALVLPPGHAASPPGEDDIQPAVGIDVDKGHRARVAVVHALGAKAQAPFIPQDRVWPGVVRQHHVLVAVVVQVADGDAGAVGFEVIDRVAGDGGDVVKGGGDEAVSARLGGHVQRGGRYSDWNIASSRHGWVWPTR